MSKKVVENKTGAPIFVGGKMIGPGEVREVDVHDSEQGPDEGSDGPRDELPPDLQALVEIQAKNVKDLKEALPGLSAEQLIELVSLEEGSAKPRSTVLEAIAAAQLALAQKAAGGEPT